MTLSASERWPVQVMLTVFVLLVCAAFTPVMLALKVLEGLYVATRITRDCLAQVWQVRGEADGV